MSTIERCAFAGASSKGIVMSGAEMFFMGLAGFGLVALTVATVTLVMFS